ncbi:MAG TPA: methyltransferase domain-containing protein [Gaiellaceae bacterium]|jgi:O-antigen chain-terminating methyltransferase
MTAELSADERDVTAIVSRLRELVEAQGADGRPGAGRPRVARAEAERLWAVSADRPYLYKPGLAGKARGYALLPVKALVKRLMRWYVEPVATDQRAFNAAVLRALDELSEASSRDLMEAVTGLTSELQGQRVETGALGDRLSRLVDELEERVYRLERRPAAPAAPGAPTESAPAQESYAPPFDYFSLEMRIRGPRADIRERQRAYVDDFREAAPVLDVGAGRGEFLDLLGEAGIDARGIEVDPELVDYGRSQGLSVELGDAVGHLEGLEDGSLGGIFAAQLVEHLPPDALVRFLTLAAAKLRPEGVLVAETINPLSLVALKHYFADPTHAQPLVPQTLEVLARQAGFRRTEVRFLNEPSEDERLRAVELPGGAEFDSARAALAGNVELLNAVVFGAQDYALYART